MFQRFLPLAGFLTLLLAALLPAYAEGPAEITQLHPEVSLSDIDVSVPRLRVRPPVSETTLNIYEKLPSRLFFSASEEVSLRLETNPYQAPRDKDPFTEATNAFRSQTDVNVGYAFTPKTRLSASYFLLHDQYNDFTPYHLDSTVNSVAVNLEHDIYQNNRWLVRGNVTARQLFLPQDRQTGDLLPSLTVMRSVATNGWAFGNVAMDLNSNYFAIGKVERISSIFTLGTGYQVPWENPKPWLRPLKGVSVNLSSSYTHNAEMNPPKNFGPWHYQNIIVTGEVSRKLRKNWPVYLFLRNEAVFNLETNPKIFGLNGINYRLFGGTRVTTSKAPVFTSKLDNSKD